MTRIALAGGGTAGHTSPTISISSSPTSRGTRWAASAVRSRIELLTAIFFGILVFHEHLTFRISVGIVLILTAVSIIISEKTISTHLKLLFHRRQALH